jgi:hypothetical protein
MEIFSFPFVNVLTFEDGGMAEGGDSVDDVHPQERINAPNKHTMRSNGFVFFMVYRRIFRTINDPLMGLGDLRHTPTFLVSLVSSCFQITETNNLPPIDYLSHYYILFN